MSACLEFIPIKQLSERYAEGWRLAYTLTPADYAALMYPPGVSVPCVTRAAVSRNVKRYSMKTVPAPKKTVPLDEIEEENHQLRSRIAELTGQHEKDRSACVRVFRLTPAETTLFLMLVHRGTATHDHLKSSLFEGDKLGQLNDADEAVRSHAKRLRRKIRPHGLEFSTVYGFGFEMDDATRKRAKERLAA
jgi:DNA-binding response OmpR family regulator